MQPSAPGYPVRVRGDLDPGLSRWMWLVKWILAIPHVIVLIFLYIAYFVVTIVAFFAILFTGKFPRALFDFNVGVKRWAWRVRFYGYTVLGTDRYPPFGLQPDPNYPADLEVDYPEQLNRWLVLIKWWLLAIPHYLILAALLGGGRYQMTLLPILIIVAAIGLLFTGRYPRGLYDFVLGINRWAIRVYAYASLMTDAYPPFRLDQGPNEPEQGLRNDSELS
ncbi:DUF4389 domain-containing protein [Nocardia sp. NBC_01503]|uniref:DUF4389 domain-containing protein n=1 Tax=Nocardia sp. NBC_01503 TaxID=2975997 RepID=UPI002E7AE6C7|nr:DUF4389 domain-containing protein [Nocardia sp. NBC_01503]WTL33310.1 DUF4389 domain-containing protein [Nocardia sp. NBC_01503]